MPDIKKNLQLFCTPAQWQLIEQFVGLLLEYNKNVNLISRQDTAAVFEHHVAASFLYKILERIHDNEHILDIGSGGGFPGIINAILWPKSQFVLVDSTRKKVNFLQSAITDLGLSNAQAVWSRIENLAQDQLWQNKFDHTTSRAVAPLADLLQWSKPLLKQNGTIEALKGDQIEQELEQLASRYSTYHLPPEQQYSSYLEHACIVSVPGK